MRPSRRQLLKGGASTALGASILGRARAAGPAERAPNVVLVLSDQHSHRAVAAHGHPDVVTPNLDRLASMGTSFTRSYCADPTCVPARAAIMTGRPSSEHGALINPMELRADIPDLGQWLREHSGHRPVYMGKWHIPGRALGQSFDLLSYTSSAGENSDLSLVRSFEGFLQNTDPATPFVLVLSLYNPHDIVHLVDIQNIWEGPADLDLGDVELPELPRNFTVPDREAAVFQSMKRRDGREAGWSDAKWRTYRWWYDRQVETLDSVLGRILEVVENSPHAANTALLYTSDHGDNQGEHRLINKQALYEAAAKVPLMAAWPGVWKARGIEAEHLVSGMDILPTICELVGAPPPPDCRGRSLVPVLKGEAKEWRTHLQVQSMVEGRLIATKDHTWIGFRDDPVQQLFNVTKDPWQLQDLGTDPAHAKELARHAALQAQTEAELDNVDLSGAGFEATMEAMGRE